VNQDVKKIQTDSKVAIVGGGPAGCFFALYLLRYASERGIHPEITIYQERDFKALGAKGCKGCAGILSVSLLRNMRELSLSVPEEIIQDRIHHYTVHSPYTSISISNPEKEIEIASIYRGGGPSISHYEHSVSLDGWLLSQAQKQGAKVESKTVSRISLTRNPLIEVEGRNLEYDLIVLASGMNTKSIPITGLEYIPPKTRTMVVAELYAGVAAVQTRLGNAAHVFLIPRSGLIFGTLVPKGPYINVSLLNTSKYPISMHDFLQHNLVKRILPDKYELTCACRPQTVVGSARNYFANGFVALGDAAVTRLYKDGIGSSLLTAREAANIVISHGLRVKDFRRYYKPFCKHLAQDNMWGRLLFRINDRAKNSRLFLLAQHRLIGDEQYNIRGTRPFTKAAWGMFTGSYSYRTIANLALSPFSLMRLALTLAGECLSGLSRQNRAYPRRLYVGIRNVLILGSGFGGTYALRHLIRILNKNDNVKITMVSDENFFLFSPLLHKVAMGSIEPRHIAYPVRRLHWRDRFKFVQASVEKIDLSTHKVITTMGTLDFDYLVLALGSVTDTSKLNSLEDNVFMLKTLRDSMLIRNHIIGVFERASLERDPQRQRQMLTFIVSGAGYIGIQLVAELRDFIHKNLIRFYKTIDPDNVRIILVEVEHKIVAELHTKLGAYAMKHFQRMGIEVRLRSRVTRVWKDCVEINNSERVPTSTLIWVAGMIANPRIAELNVEKDSLSRVLVNKYLEVPRVPGVYAIGDCAHFKEPRSGQPIPPRAHTAVRQAKIVAHNVLAEIRGRDKKPYRYSHTAELVSLGAHKAIFRFHGLRLYGFPARLIWLVAYSFLVTGIYNRIRIIMDWLLSLVFGQDITFLKLIK